jgi:hypothetical protein
MTGGDDDQERGLHAGTLRIAIAVRSIVPMNGSSRPTSGAKVGAMRTLLVPLLAVALAGCNKKKDEPTPPPEPKTDVKTDPPASCPPGNALKDGKCAPVVTPEKVAAVAQEQSRLEDLAKLLDKTDTVAATVELLDNIRQTDPWKQLVAATPKLKVVDDAVGTLGEGVKQLRAFKVSLADAGTRLGNLKGELDTLLKSTGAAKQLDDVKKQVSTEIRGALEPLEQQVIATIDKGIVPLATQLDSASDLILGACAVNKLSGGSDKLKELCGQAKEAFAKATVFLTDVKAKPAELFSGVSAKLEAELADLIDTESKKFLDDAQAKVNAAMKLPPAGSGSAH